MTCTNSISLIILFQRVSILGVVHRVVHGLGVSVLSTTCQKHVVSLDAASSVISRLWLIVGVRTIKHTELTDDENEGA